MLLDAATTDHGQKELLEKKWWHFLLVVLKHGRSGIQLREEQHRDRLSFLCDGGLILLAMHAAVRKM